MILCLLLHFVTQSHLGKCYNKGAVTPQSSYFYMWFCQQVSWELFGCFPNLAVTWLIHLKRQEHHVLRSACWDIPLKTCLMASPICGCIGFITENEKNREAVVFVLLWEHRVHQSCREKENVKDDSSVVRCVCGWNIMAEKGWNSSDLAKGIILSSQISKYFFFSRIFVGALWGFVWALFPHMKPSVSGKTPVLWLC